jgi:ABC-type sugar transport system substrate-binding protein
MSSRVRFVAVLPDGGQDFQRFQAEDAHSTGEKLGVDIQVVFAENTPILQIQQLYKAIRTPEEMRANVLLVEPIPGDGLERLARAATDVGIHWLVLNRRVPYIQSLRDACPALQIASVSTDQTEIGRIQGRQVRTLLRGDSSGLVLYLQGPPDTSAAQERLKGTQEVLATTRIELKVLEGRWTESSGHQAVERWLRLKQHVQPDLMVCQNDLMALGARRALAAAGVDASMPVLGADGLRDGGQKFVANGQLAATITRPSSTGHAIHLMMQALRTGARLPAEILLPPDSFPSLPQLTHQVATRRRSSLG